jgi:hypothetical protein
MELESRLIKSVNRFYAQYLLPRVIGNITNEQIATLYEIYQTDLTCNLDEFKREIARWRTRWSKTPRDQMPTSLCETLDAVNTVLYPSIDTILCIMLTMPVTSATAERSFSVLRRLKTYVRSTMKPHQTPPPFPGLVACTAKKASYAPDNDWPLATENLASPSAQEEHVKTSYSPKYIAIDHSLLNTYLLLVHRRNTSRHHVPLST